MHTSIHFETTKVNFCTRYVNTTTFRFCCVNDDLRADGLQKGWQFRVGTWNVDSVTGRSDEVVEALSDRKVDVACIQETRWKGSGYKFYGAKGQ